MYVEAASLGKLWGDVKLVEEAFINAPSPMTAEAPFFLLQLKDYFGAISS